MVKRQIQKQSFSAVDAAGKRKTLRVLVDILDAGHFGDPDAEVEGREAIVTSEGKPVEWVGSKKYQLIETGEILTSDDPNAP